MSLTDADLSTDAGAGAPDDPSSTLVKGVRRYVATRTGTLRARRSVTSESKQLSAGMTANLSAELEGMVAPDLIADIVRAVVDESRHTPADRAVESMMSEARQRLERFIRARIQVASTSAGPTSG